MTDLQRERRDLQETLQSLSKQNIDALYRLADLESDEMRDIRALSKELQKELGKAKQNKTKLRQALLDVSRLAEKLASQLGERTDGDA
jgi:septation ring formation regulator EzrA